MEHLIMVTGGCRSGKSEFAENLFDRDDEVCYIATSNSRSGDKEMEDRIQKHQARRSKKWMTEERYANVAKYMETSKKKYFLLDDVTNMVTALFYDWVNEVREGRGYPNAQSFLYNMGTEELDEVTHYILQQWINIMVVNSLRNKTLVVVTNEVGLGIVPEDKDTRMLRDIYGEVNKLIASKSDEVWFVISGLPQKIK
ncbi:bifunctional adenosylcobinamide kinase/adenosylcobinamide-phosphate guanylyltransferase [Companilactobacillus zhongbaensis]|uniref:bifunctional adenosylcobinamide kinase/adenosylcobinamide-phosphate guanylyltransferase n=1 Tax=Companilactobacillus zhongbaensis TaxID=2486009 RepID=UPI000F798BE5|nr:bifunctional adenosylcobinamide kinase/adenosylcobinamide-phosphate guanylyltransferase [Companilactobacillus zhongbaensis]